MKLGYKQSEIDKAAFRWYNGNKLEGILIIHVDDFFVAGTSHCRQKVIEKLTMTFKIGCRQTGNFRYVGLETQHEAIGIRMSQNTYIDEMTEIDIQINEKNGSDRLTSEELRILRGLSGQILWTFGQTRLDAWYDSLALSVEKNKATVETVRRGNKVVRKLKRRQHRIFFPKTGKFNQLELHVYSDAFFANLPNGASHLRG